MHAVCYHYAGLISADVSKYFRNINQNLSYDIFIGLSSRVITVHEGVPRLRLLVDDEGAVTIGREVSVIATALFSMSWEGSRH